jgi:hypothetical protein
LQALDALEALEDPLLCWGVVDGGLTDEELLQALDQVLLATGELGAPEELAEILQQRGLILCDDSTSPQLWRTRNGETLRLLARLRQVFLSNNPQAAWRHGAQLVADFRYARRPRAYPRRDQNWDSPLTDEIDHTTYREVLRLLTAKPTRQDSGNFDIAGFQVRATTNILASLKTQSTSGTVVGAGTGSGKTLAFYLPALSYITALEDTSAWTRAIAVYPRNELLRDQFSTAFANARKLDAVATTVNGRPLTMGVLNGDTPHSSAALNATYSTWKKSPQGYLCPSLTCPSDGGKLYWPKADAESGTECLVCSSCQTSFDSSVVVLTRNRMRQSPPDLLFTTTEMLNRNISNLEMRHVLGIGVAKKPRLMLLDEIHTYEGTTGAQAAMTIRRWHHGVQGPVSFVGLSATLSDAVRHFSDLTGVDREFVTSIEPMPAEMEFEGAEYMIAVRSDPTSGASVLSTTIQTSMLLPRTLDAPAVRSAAGTFGTKAFVFTDDLDVTNRLFSYLLDAEGQRYSGQHARQVRAPLASMRMPISGDVGGQRRAGQSWDLPLTLGHQFQTTGLKVSRTSSQDAGVDADSQIIVATASLEVGFDDPDVGAVLQHKAPRGVATFLQRKGRAGRTRGMRPYTAVVLSDYGRDRATYEAWDALFDPVLPKLVLPIRNSAVLRMQAALATMDWVAEQMRLQKPDANLWRDLSSIDDGNYGRKKRETQLAAADLLNRVLRDPSLHHSLRKWIAGALKLTDNVVDEILWHPPRAVILAAVPTLVRRLRAEWAVATPGGLIEGKDSLGGNPLPDFFPPNLFSDLALPEGFVLVPPQHRDVTEPEMHAMGLAQMLREFAPGRVSRRFATRDLSHRHWIPIPTEVRDAVIDIPTILPVFRQDSDLLVDIEGTPTTLKLIRPDQLKLELAPAEIKDSSNAFLTWSTQFTATGAGLEARIPTTDPIGRFVKDAKFFLHAQNSQVEARRAAIESEASMMLDSGDERRVRTRFRLDGQRVSLGATYDVDGMCLRFEPPSIIKVPDEIAPGIKSAWFRHVITTDSQLLEHVNTFQLNWLFEALEAMLLTTSVDKQCTLEAAYAEVRKCFADKLHETLQAMFRSPDVAEEGDDTISRLGKRLTELLRETVVVERLDRLVEQAWKPDADAFQEWLRHRVISTFGQAVLSAAREICPEHDPEGLFVDIEPGLESSGKPRKNEVWLTETSIGGGGFIEALATRVRPDPRRFLRLVARALQPGTNELVDAHMHRLLSLIVSDSSWSAALAGFRSAGSQEERVTILGSIITNMRQAGVYGAEQSVVSCMANRLLRPGSTTATDQALQKVVGEWRTEEERLGVEIPSRTWAYLMRARTDLDTGLNMIATDTEQHRIDSIQSLLWPRGWSLRAGELESYNPYSGSPPSAPDLVHSMLENSREAVDVAAQDADRRVRELLAYDGSAQLTAKPAHSGRLSDLLVELSTRAIETDFLQVYPRITEIRHLPDGTAVVSLELAELAL